MGKYGVNTAEVEKIIEKVKTITPEHAEALAAARSAVRDAAWDAARGAAWDTAWSAVRDAARGAAWSDAWVAARGAAWDAIYDALLATFTRGMIPQEQTELLLVPWASAMEEQG